MNSCQTILIGLLLLGAAMSKATPESAATTNPGSTAQIVEARSRAWIKAAIEGEADVFRTFATDDYLMLYAEPATAQHPARWGTRSRDEWVASIRAGKVKYRSVELRKTKVHVNRNIAILSGEYTQTALRDGAEVTEGGLFVETWVRRGGQWLAVSQVFP